MKLNANTCSNWLYFLYCGCGISGIVNTKIKVARNGTKLVIFNYVWSAAVLNILPKYCDSIG